VNLIYKSSSAMSVADGSETPKILDMLRYQLGQFHSVCEQAALLSTNAKWHDSAMYVTEPTHPFLTVHLPMVSHLGFPNSSRGE